MKVSKKQNRTRPHQGHRRSWSLGLISLLPMAAALLAFADEVPPANAPALRCEVTYLSETTTFDTPPTQDPYRIPARDIAGRFQFKAVVVGDAGRVDHISLYAYDLSVPAAPVLVHQVTHKPPFPNRPAVPALTGWNHVYSSKLGRELVYGCALQAPRPAP